ncbi:hypothetical protein E8E11_011657 [Didymella keratinophila]|nr:hypothetical protein E8E11_011657 [Didymella keratinophila]
MACIPPEACTPESKQWMKDTSFIWSHAVNGFPLGPNPKLVGEVEPTGTMRVITKDFYFVEINYKKGMEGQLMAYYKGKDGKEWVRIIVEGVATDKHIKTGFAWVDAANIEMTRSLAGDALMEATSRVARPANGPK